LTEIPEKNLSKPGPDKLLRKLRETGSGRPRTARTDENIAQVDELVLSQKYAPQTHRSVRQILREICLPKSSVSRVIHKDFTLNFS